MIDAGFLGTGWAFPPHRADDGTIGMVARDELVGQSIWLILATAPGERMHRPEFGCGIHDLVFEVGDATTAGSVERAVREALTSFEPRADVLDVRVGAPDDQPMTLVVEVDYLVRSTNNRFNLVYPFYLDAGPTA